MKKSLIIAILVAVAAFLGGCATTYSGKKCQMHQPPLICGELDPGISLSVLGPLVVVDQESGKACFKPELVPLCSEFSVRSRRTFKDGIEVEYNSETGDLKITAGSVENDDNVIEKIGLKVIETGFQNILGERNE